MCLLCKKCTRSAAVIVFVLGILFLLQNLGVWNFWNIQPWTAVFIVAGLAMFCSSGCPMCVECREACCGTKTKGRKRK